MRAESGKWKVENGKWRVESGKWKEEEHSTLNTQHLTLNTQHLVLLCFLLFNSPMSVLCAQTAVGQWRDCLDYSMVLHVEPAGRYVYAAARGGVFCYDTATRTLVVAYNNSNIDLVKDGRVYNISDIKRSSIGGDKSIYRIRFNDRKAWVATGFGVVVVDLDRREIKETCYIGTGGTYTVVSDLAFSADSLYAATAEGLKRIAVSEPHPTISDRWTADSRLAGVTVTMLDYYAGHLLAGGFTSDPGLTTLYALDSTVTVAWNGDYTMFSNLEVLRNDL